MKVYLVSCDGAAVAIFGKLSSAKRYVRSNGMTFEWVEHATPRRHWKIKNAVQGYGWQTGWMIAEHEVRA